MQADKYIDIIKVKLDQKKAELLEQLTNEYNNIIKNKEKELEDIKRKALKDLSK